MPARTGLATPAEVAAHVRKSPKTLAMWRWRGIGPVFLKLENGNIRYRWADVDQWLERQSVRPRSAR